MKVWELREALSKYSDELPVILIVNDEDTDSFIVEWDDFGDGPCVSLIGED